jgi:hypothetical protein
MRVLENQDFDSSSISDRNSAATYGNAEFRRCNFQGCSFALTNNPASRPIVRNLRMVNCSQRGCTLYAPILENIVVDGLDTNGQLLRTHGAVFNRVALRGRIGRLMLSNDPLPSVSLSSGKRHAEMELFRAANAEYYQRVDWALDISEGQFDELSIRGIPSDLVRRDSETQFVVTRKQALEGRWRDLEFRRTVWAVTFGLFLERNEPSLILIAPKGHAQFQDYLADLRLLRDAGVAERN